MADTDRMKRALGAITRLQAKLDALEGERRVPIALLGMSCRFPGGANDPQAFWRLVRDGVDAVIEVPRERWEPDAWYDPDPEAPGKMYSKWGGYLQGVDLRGFDAQFFGIAPREAIEMDPQQRLLLELAWEALEDAGQAVDRLAGSRTGVFIGISTNDYSALDSREGLVRRINAYTGTGNSDSVAAGRISYVLGLEGPNMALDTSCSASLVAAHLACQSLRAGECDMALAGGVNLILTPYNNVYFSKLRAMAPDGRCKSFDASANGYTRGEGGGIVVLKRLADARAAGDPILALIRGSAINHDGRSNGLTAPSGTAQQEVLRAALTHAGIDPAEVAYVETHGTGTQLGDPIEAEALAAVLGAGRSKDRPVYLGAVKTNLGHLEAAAGIAGLIKLALVLGSHEIPPIVHLRQPSPFIPWESYPLALPAARGEWPEGRARLGGVSSFGFSGTNAHVVLEGPPALDAAPIEGGRAVALLPLSARSPEALQALARSYVEFLRGEGSALDLSNICFTAGARRSHHDHRLALAGRSHMELAAKLESFLRGEAVPGLARGSRPAAARKVAFVFSGQGPQWVGMGRRLFDVEPVFHDAFLQADRAVARYVGSSLVEELGADAAGSRLEEIDWLQPVLFAIQVALVSLWRSWGVEPDAVVGHSMGEIAASHVAGALTLDDAARIVCLRSRMLKAARGHGMMLAVELGREEAEVLLRGYEDRASIAVNNGPASSVLSGETAALEEIARRLESEGVWCRPVAAAVASHSPHMERFRTELAALLAGLAPTRLEAPFYSTAVPGFGRDLADGARIDAGYWWHNLRQPVLFYDAVRELDSDGHGLFIEISPHPVLGGAVQQALPEARVFASMRRDEDGQAVMLESLAGVYSAGFPVPWERVQTRGRCVRLPAYPWQRAPYWIETLDPGTASGARPGQGRHPLLGRRHEIGGDPPVVVWETELGIADLPLLGDHRIHGAAVVPATLYLEMLLEAAADLFGDRDPVVRALEVLEMLALPEGGAATVQLELESETADAAAFALRRKLSGTWVLLARGRLEAAGADGASEEPTAEAPEEIRRRTAAALSGEEYYRQLERLGYVFGPRFRGIERVWKGNGEALARVRAPDPVRPHVARHRMHPALLDACFQVAGAGLGGPGRAADEVTYVVVGLEELRLHASLPLDFWCHARLRGGETASGALVSDLAVFDDAGRAVVTARGFRLEPLRAAQESDDRLADRLFHVTWRESEGGPQAAPAPGLWLLFSDRAGLAGALAQRLERAGNRVVQVGRAEIDPRSPEDFRRVVIEALALGAPLRGVVHAWSLDLGAADRAPDLDELIDAGTGSALHLVQALVRCCPREAPRLWLVTRGAQPAGSPSAVGCALQAPLWGFGRSAAHEHPEIAPTLVDLDPSPEHDEADRLARELAAAGPETQVAYRGGARFVARLVRAPAEAAPRNCELPAGGVPFGLRPQGTRTVRGAALSARERQPPGPGQVEIEVRAAALNFRDVLTTLGTLPVSGGDSTLGTDCAGIVAEVGEGVTRFRPGDAVIAFAPGAIGSQVTTWSRFAIPKPASLKFEEAATLPLPFLTAWYSLREVARLRAGETVLIHAGAGGVGLAALQIAQSCGARIFASAGSPEKRELLRSLGVDVVVDSRSLGFADEIRAVTGGRGVDVVLNSLAGPFFQRSLECLARFGRFVEIGKVEPARGLRLRGEPLLGAVTLAFVDIQALCRHSPEAVESMMAQLAGRISDGSFRPLIHRVFPVSRSAEALELMARGGHVGRCVVSIQDPEARVSVDASQGRLRADRTYLLAGGLGALGLSLARWMIRGGARHFAFLARGAHSVAARQSAAALEHEGARVVLLEADVGDRAAVARALDEMRRDLPPLGGVVHLAGVLDDGTLLHLDRKRLAGVLRPKVQGARVLDELTRGLALDFFVLYSSATALLGAPGQANYAAANAFLDALAHARRAQGLPALSVNWGPFAATGVSPENLRRVAGLGMGSLEPGEGNAALARLLAGSAVAAGVFPIDVRQWLQVNPKSVEAPFLAELVREGDSGQRAAPSEIRERLASAGAAERRPLLDTYIREQLAQVLRLPASAIGAETPFRALGLDSLMGLEIRNRLERGLGLRLPATLVWAHPSAAALHAELASRLGLNAAAPSPAESAPRGAAPALDGLSEDELAGALAEELRTLTARKTS